MFFGEFLIYGLLGLLIGSFINVLLVRLHNNENPVTGRSHCRHCKKTLRYRDLIPVISFIVLKGKCRDCKASIGHSYVWVELVTMLSFIGINLFPPDPKFLLLYFTAAFMLVFIAFYDLLYLLVLDVFIIPSIFTVLFINIILTPLGFIEGLVFYGSGMVVGGLFFLLQYVLTRGRGIGGGDIRIGMFLGALLGIYNIFLALMVSYIVAFFFSLFLLLTKKVNLKSRIPLAPFLCIGGYAVLLWHDVIWMYMDSRLNALMLIF